MPSSFIMACFFAFTLRWFIHWESVIFILPAEVGSEIDFSFFYKLRG